MMGFATARRPGNIRLELDISTSFLLGETTAAASRQSRRSTLLLGCKSKTSGLGFTRFTNFFSLLGAARLARSLPRKLRRPERLAIRRFHFLFYQPQCAKFFR